MEALRKILLVDDDADIRTICTLSLETIGGYDVQTCINGREALDCISSFDPDLVVLDVMMPELDGPSTLARLKEDGVTGNVPVVFLTARSGPEDTARFLEMGARAVVPKPFDPVALPGVLRSIYEGGPDGHAGAAAP